MQTIFPERAGAMHLAQRTLLQAGTVHPTKRANVPASTEQAKLKQVSRRPCRQGQSTGRQGKE